jgi:hypothetical protein
MKLKLRFRIWRINRNNILNFRPSNGYITSVNLRVFQYMKVFAAFKRLQDEVLCQEH